MLSWRAGSRSRPACCWRPSGWAPHIVAGRSVIWPIRLATTLINLGQIAGRRGDLDQAVGLGAAVLRCGRQSAELLPRAAELERRLSGRSGTEQLVNNYGELIREEVRALPPGDARRLEEAVGRRLAGRPFPDRHHNSAPGAAARS